MMPASLLLDIVLVLVLLTFLVSGYRSGFARSLGGIVGFVAGGLAAFFLVPLVGTWVVDSDWRTPAVLIAALLLLAVGTSVGTGIGYAVRRRIERTPLGIVDRLFGSGLSVVAAALVSSILAFSVGSLGVPFLSPAIASSSVIRTIDRWTPTPARAAIAQARAFVLSDGLRIIDAVAGPTPDIPAETPLNDALTGAARSVVRITGTAYACGQNQSGSGFVIAADRVMTNAHVVAGVVEPIVQTPSGQSLPGRVVYFDPVDDLAVIRVSGLDATALALTPDLTPGTTAVTNGYPFGGPFDADPALVVSVDVTSLPDIYGENRADRRVYTLASDIEQGESGGPLLSDAGLVAGVIFAKSANEMDVGYALAMEEVEPVVAVAPGLVEPVSSGRCATV